MDLYPPGATFCKTCGYCLHALTVNRCPECGHDFDPANPKTFRTRPLTHRLKWVVRAGVVVLLLAAVPVGYWGWLWWGWKAEQPVVARLTAKGARITTTVIGPEWVKRWMPEKAAFVLVRTKEVATGTTSLADADLLGLENLTELEVLNLNYSDVTEASLPMVGRLMKLKKFWLYDKPVTDQGLESLKELRQLEGLTLIGPSITGRGLACLGQNPGMKELFLFNTQVDDGSVATILGFARLESLWLVDCQLTDAGLPSLGQLPSLQEVSVYGPKITEAGCKALRKAKPGLMVNNTAYRAPPATAPVE